MMTSFDPASAALGGILIGIAAALLILLTGRIAGISGILAGCIAVAGGERGWRAAFLLGLIAAPVIGLVIGFRLPEPLMPRSWALIIVAGLMVGFGTRLGGGCTSGHGVCGMSRLSTRSIVATVIFMLSAIAVVFVSRHGLGI